MATEISLCNRALQLVGTRSTITAFNDGSSEATNCDLLFDAVRDQTLAMAHWNFARRSKPLTQKKAAPGVAGATISSSARWSPVFPPVPWAYEYEYPSDCVRARYLIGSTPGVSGVPIFSTPSNYYPYASSPPSRFAVVNDFYQVINSRTAGTLTLTTAVLNAADQQANDYYNGMQIAIDDGAGHSGVATVTDYVNATNTIIFSSITGLDTTSTAYSYAIGNYARAIVTNQYQAILTYVGREETVDVWDSTFTQAFVSALAGFLAMPLTGDKKLVGGLFDLANNHVMQAREIDANEGLTIQEHTPDWIAVRGVGSTMSPYGMYYEPYPPLFDLSMVS